MSLPKITFPTFTFELPSSGEKISIRPMLVKEEKILLIAKESKDALDVYTAIKQIIHNCIVTKHSMDKLTLFDIDYLFLKIRAISISNVIKLGFTDEEDIQDKVTKNYEFEVNLDEVKINFAENISNIVEFKNGNTTIKIVLKYPSSKLYDNKEVFKATNGIEVFDKLKLACIDKILVDGSAQDTNSKELTEWLDTIPLHVSNDISEYIMKLPRLHHELKYTNSRGNERRIVLSKLEDFFTL